MQHTSFYEAVPWLWSFFQDEPTEEKINKILSLADGGTILEVGCGAGNITAPLLEHGCKVTGIDLVAMPECALGAAFIQANFMDYTFDSKYDLVLFHYSLPSLYYSIPSISKILFRAESVLNQNGRIIIIDNNTNRNGLLATLSADNNKVLAFNTSSSPLEISGKKYVIQHSTTFNECELTTKWNLYIDEINERGEVVNRIIPPSLNERLFRVETIEAYYQGTNRWQSIIECDLGKENLSTGREVWVISEKKC